MNKDKFPIQVHPHIRVGGGFISWNIAELVYKDYSKKYGTGQSLERIAECGGFGLWEIATHLLEAIKQEQR